MITTDTTIGFVGTGTITRAMVEGLARDPDRCPRIVLSPRNAETAAFLDARHRQVRVAADNQAVVDAADIVVLAIRPQIAGSVVDALAFRPGQTVLSVIAATDRPTLLGWIGADVDLVQAVPLPFVEHAAGVTAVYPPDPVMMEMFDRLGTAVGCRDKAEYDLLAAASATMAFHLGQMGRIVDWLAARGLPPESGRTYVARLFESLAAEALARPELSLAALSAEFATKGGLNEQVWRDFEDKGGTAALTAALERVHKRIAP